MNILTVEQHIYYYVLHTEVYYKLIIVLKGHLLAKCKVYIGLTETKLIDAVVNTSKRRALNSKIIGTNILGSCVYS